MYGRVANPRVSGGSTHLKNVPISSSGVGTGGGKHFFFVIWVKLHPYLNYQGGFRVT